MVMFRRMMFAVVVRAIVNAVTPKIEELALSIAAFEPLETLVHRLGCFGCHCAHGGPLGGDVVGGDHGAFVLWMAHFFECGADGNS